MGADYNKPVTTDNYADLLTQLRDNIAAAQTMLNDLTGVTNIPTGALRYDQTLNKFQSYSGSTFDDLVLSPSGGGTGITNWAKATTAEAEAGTANKYPDAAGVLASIGANGFDGSNTSLVWSGSSTSVDLNAIGGGYPGDGLYIVEVAGRGWSLLHFINGESSTGIAGFFADSGLETLGVYTVQKDGSNILTAPGGVVNQANNSISPIGGGILEIRKIVR